MNIISSITITIEYCVCCFSGLVVVSILITFLLLRRHPPRSPSYSKTNSLNRERERSPRLKLKLESCKIYVRRLFFRYKISTFLYFLSRFFPFLLVDALMCTNPLVVFPAKRWERKGILFFSDRKTVSSISKFEK